MINSSIHLFSERQLERMKQIIQQTKKMQGMSNEDKLKSFLEFQEFVNNIYWGGLEQKFPDKSIEELSKIALQETQSYEERKRNLQRLNNKAYLKQK